MKKFKCIAAVLLGLGVIAGGAMLCACADDNGDNNNGGLTTDKVEAMIKDEETWKSAFDEIDYANYTVNTSAKVDGENANGYIKITADGSACSVMEYTAENSTEAQIQELYTVKTGVEKLTNITITNFTTYFYDSFNSEGWEISYESGEGESEGFGSLNYYQLKTQTSFNLEYGDNYNKFTFDKDTLTYSYDGEINGKTIVPIYNEDNHMFEDTELTVSCTNNVITVKDNKIVKIKCTVNIEGQLEDAIYEYYDFGTTVVTIPQEALDTEKNDK